MPFSGGPESCPHSLQHILPHQVKALYGDEAEGALISNLKRGIASLLQLQPHAGTTVEVRGCDQQLGDINHLQLVFRTRHIYRIILFPWMKGKTSPRVSAKQGLPVFQEDASGSCRVTYTVSNHSITKTKDLPSCTKPKLGFTSVNKASPWLLWRW